MGLTDAWLKANHKKQRVKTETVTDRDGLSVRVSPKGKLTFQLRYRHGGKQDRMDLGSYPNLSLKDARAETLRLREKLEKGHNPKIVKALEKHTIANADTFESLTRQWYESDCKGRISNAPSILRTFELHVFKDYGHLPAAQIPPRMWYALLEPMAAKVPSMANRVVIYGKQVYRWAIRREILEYNPMADISAIKDLRVKQSNGQRILDNAELKLLWDALENSRLAYKNKLLFRLALVFGCRGIELREAQKQHFDLKNKIWTIPTDHHKTGRAHDAPPIFRPIIPITEQWIREAIDLTPGKPLLFAQVKSDDPMKGSDITNLPYNLMRWVKKNRGVDMEHWSFHDIRRTARTNWSSLTRPDVAEMMLGHSVSNIRDVYDKYEYLDEKREAYETWWERLRTIVK